MPAGTLPTISELVPHRGPMSLLDSVRRWEEGAITCEASIRPDHPFLDGGVVDVLVAVELVAQAVAAYAGQRDRLAGKRPRIGFLVSCREASFEVESLALGDTLTIEVQHVWGDDTLGSFKGRVLRAGALVASVEVGVYGGPLDRMKEGV